MLTFAQLVKNSPLTLRNKKVQCSFANYANASKTETKNAIQKNSIILLYDATLLLSLKLNLGIRSGLLHSGIHSNTTYAFLARNTVAKNAYELRNVRLSVRSSACISAAPTRRISVKFVIGDFMKICRENLDLVKIGQKQTLYMKTYVRFIVAGYINSSQNGLCDNQYYCIFDSNM